MRGSGPAGAPGGAPLPQALVDLEPLQRAAEANPTDPAALLRLANGLHDNHAYLRAADAYKKYLALRPKNPNARVDLGICYYELSSLDTANTVQYLMMALTEMQRAHADSAAHQPAVFNLGVVNLRLGNLEESNKWFREAVHLNRASDLGVRAQQMLEQHTLPQQ
jgi:tetratricopeptide (TPR) repeat protein